MNVNTRKNMAYNDLPLSERAQIIHMGVQTGLKSLSDIRSFYDNAVNEYAEGGGIHIAPSKKGTFTAAATKHGKSVQAFASQVLAHKENYSPAMVKKANFARNAAHWHDGDSDTQHLNIEVYEPWFPDKHKEDYGFNIGQWIGPMHVREMQLGNAKNHSEASSYLVDSNKGFINDYVSKLSAAHPELSSAALSNIRTALSPESISFVSDDAFAKSNTAGETTARREGNRIIPEIRLRDNIGYYDTQNKSRDLSNIFRHELHHFLRKYQGNYTNSIFNPEERETLNSAYFAVPSTLERGAENARLRSIIAQNNGNVWGKYLDNIIDNLSYEDLLSYISNMEGYMKNSESLYTAPNKEAVSNLQSKIAEKDKERETILNTVIYPKYLIPYEDGVYIKDNIINQYKTREGEEASVVRDAMFKEWNENKDLKRIAYERKALEEELKKALMAPNKERLDSVKKALKQVAQNNNGFQKPNNAYLAALGGNLKSTCAPRWYGDGGYGGYNWLPDFAYNPSIQSDNGRQLVQAILQDRNIQRAVQQKALQRQEEIEAQRKAVSEIYNGMPNPGAGYVSGTDPLLQAIVDMTPAGDAEMATEAASELRNGNLKEAGLLGAALLLPNIFNKGIKKWRASKAISKELNNGIKNSDLQISAFDKGVLSGKIGWAPSQDISWRHGSTNPNLTKFVPYDRWDVVNRGASPYEYFVTEKSSPLNMMDERPFQYYGSYAARKPLIQVGEVNLNGQKNSTRNSLLQEGWKRGADSYILQGISDNKAIGQNVVVIPIGAKGELIHSTGGPLYPFSFSKQPVPAVRFASGGDTNEEFIPSDTIRNKQVWLNKGTAYQRQRPGTVNLQNITDRLDPLGADIQYVWDSPDRSSYSAFRRNPDYRASQMSLIKSATSNLFNVPLAQYPEIKVSVPKTTLPPAYSLTMRRIPNGNWIRMGGENNGVAGYEILHLENSPYYGIDYQSAPGSISSGEGSIIQTDSLIKGIPIQELNQRIFDYKTRLGGNFVPSDI